MVKGWVQLLDSPMRQKETMKENSYTHPRALLYYYYGDRNLGGEILLNEIQDSPQIPHN